MMSILVKRRRVAPLLACLGALFAMGLHSEQVFGFSYFQVNGQNIVWPGGQSLRYLSPSTFPPDSAPDLHYREGMGLWTIVPACTFAYSFARPSEDPPIDNYDGYSDTAAVAAADLGPGVLGVTYMVNLGPQWYDMDMLFADIPEGVGWIFEDNPDCELVANPTVHGFSFLLVATHELGHALGLGHDPNGDEAPGTPFFIQTMNPRYPAGGPVGQNNIVELHTEDRNGVRFLYPHSGPSEPPFRDLANAGYSFSSTQVGKAIPVFFTPAVVYPGAELTLRTVIENFGTTNEFNVRLGYYLSDDAVIESSDTLIADVRFDLAFEDAHDFDAIIDMPADLPAGQYFVGSIFDDLEEVAEAYEDNNAVRYCEPLTVAQLAPVINNLPQESADCGQPYSGPTPTVTHPLNMAPITWSIDNPEPGMTIDPQTGVVSWPSPVRDPFLYTIYVRATNSAGSSTTTLYLGVDGVAPEISTIGAQTAGCGVPFSGPAPQTTVPACMSPILNWSLDAGPSGMTIDHDTGEVAWPEPARSGAPYTVTVRATNAAGNGTVSFALDVVGVSDRDADGDVDLDDYVELAACVAGPEAAVDGACACVDLDGDFDVDLVDLAIFQVEFIGPRLGACCTSTGTCSVLSPGACAANGGVYAGDGSDCASAVCTGACCLPNGFCLDLSQANCAGAGGDSQGIGTLCADTSCITGACCHLDESCTELSADECAQAEGVYQGDDTDCGSADCTIPPIGACCAPDESCAEQTADDCAAIGGDYLGDETLCVDVDCAAPPGACCDPADWSCTETSEAACLAAGGSFEGSDTTCAAAVCGEYRNVVDPIEIWYPPGAGYAMADDITLSGSDRSLVYYDLAVYGGGGGAFDVTVSLYTACPGEGGVEIAGTSAIWSAVPDDDDVHVISIDLSAAPVPLPETVWMAATFSTDEAGWVLAGAAEAGASADGFGENDPPWGCDFGIDGQQASFWSSVQCIAGPPAQGACCLPGATCAELEEAACVGQGGSYQGAATTCAQVDCSSGGNLGACCLADDWSCSETTATACAAQGGVFEGIGVACTGSCPEYRNQIDPIATGYAPGANVAVGDGLMLAGSARGLTYYAFAVADGTAAGGTFEVLVELWDGSPCNGGVAIAGTGGSAAAVPADGGVYLLEFDLETPIPLPDTVWMMTQFSTASAGWVVAEAAETGFTPDSFAVYNGAWDCAASLGGAPANPYAGFWAVVQCVDGGSRTGRNESAPQALVARVQPLDAEVKMHKR